MRLRPYLYALDVYVLTVPHRSVTKRAEKVIAGSYRLRARLKATKVDSEPD